MRLSRVSIGPGSCAGAVSATSAAAAQDAGKMFSDLEVVGAPTPGGLNFQPAATGLAEDLHWLDNMLLIIIAAITVLVLAVLVYTVFRFNRSRNPEPGTFTHNSPLEVTWTVVPIIILAFIAVFSLPLLYKQQVIPDDADVTLDITGYQWYWHYDYPDQKISFDSFILQRGELADYGYSPDLYKLAVNNPVVLPVGATVVANVTGGDVIHDWTVPAFGVKQDAVPGRSAQLWFRPQRTGIYFGQCSELCGQNHAFMPITVKVVTKEQYQQWLAQAKQQYASAGRTRKLASAR